MIPTATFLSAQSYENNAAARVRPGQGDDVSINLAFALSEPLLAFRFSCISFAVPKADAAKRAAFSFSIFLYLVRHAQGRRR
jgi:hypothetical protein